MNLDSASGRPDDYAAPGMPPPHWALDPSDPQRERWWDGRTWTRHVRLRTGTPQWSPVAPVQQQVRLRPVQAAVSPSAHAVTPGSKSQAVATADGVPLAGFGRRALAMIVDNVLVSTVVSITLLVVWPDFSVRVAQAGEIYLRLIQDAAAGVVPGALPAEFATLGNQLLIVMAGATLLYSTLLLGTMGATLGQRLLGLVVVPLDQGRTRLGWRQAILRSVAWTILSSGAGFMLVIQVFSLLMPLWQPKRQTFHDLAARTQVVRGPRAATTSPPPPK